MRRALLSVVAGLVAGCPLPEEQFVLRGRVLGEDGLPLAGATVQLSRNMFASETRCGALELLAETTSDEQGLYEFELIRQQITAGVNARRFFSVSTTLTTRTRTQRFWFPDADLDLGDLGLTSTDNVAVIRETRLDRLLAWREPQNAVSVYRPDRASDVREVVATHEYRTVPIDSLGRYDIIPVESREEALWRPNVEIPNRTPRSFGAPCPFIDVVPCPLTDGRFLPYDFPPGTTSIVLNLGQELNISRMALHGLVLAGPATKVRFDFNFVADYESWNFLAMTTLDQALMSVSSQLCDEPGAYLDLQNVAATKPWALRITFEDAEHHGVAISSLREVTVP